MTLSNERARVLYIYRDYSPPFGLTRDERFMFRWRRICEEMAAHIIRMNKRNADIDISEAADSAFHDLNQLLSSGHLEPGKEPSWSLYRLTDLGRDTIAKWRQADFP